MYVGATYHQADEAVHLAMVEVARRWQSIGSPFAYARRPAISTFIRIKTRERKRRAVEAEFLTGLEAARSASHRLVIYSTTSYERCTRPARQPERGRLARWESSACDRSATPTQRRSRWTSVSDRNQRRCLRTAMARLMTAAANPRALPTACATMSQCCMVGLLSMSRAGRLRVAADSRVCDRWSRRTRRERIASQLATVDRACDGLTSGYGGGAAT